MLHSSIKGIPRIEFFLMILLLFLSSTLPLLEHGELTSKCSAISGFPFIIVASNVTIESGMDVVLRQLYAHPCVRITETVPEYLQVSKSFIGFVGFVAIGPDKLSAFLHLFNETYFKIIYLERDPLFAGKVYPFTSVLS